MPKPLERWKIDAYQQAQQADILRRRKFLTFNTPTQHKILYLLRRMSGFCQQGKTNEALGYFAKVLHREYRKNSGLTDANGVDWTEVEYTIKPACISDGDMTGPVLWPHRVYNELTILKSLLQVFGRGKRG